MLTTTPGLLHDAPVHRLRPENQHATEERDIEREVSKNVKTEMKHGKSQKQSVAIALNQARKSGKKIAKKDK
ncbi:hypothetical protein [Caballeronia ptereochthonis]|uniref:Uncharacterized protein n=1 Tax=Caballeronia ptereochthonis TaxID=1777144 RepID=A0A158E7L9_9BURK|nr:hypothetical protein [Caballeronia ptereochthonis]SAL02891.1 hypothetical protein AWB83_06678 [Caballeronia ptereochthonis]